MSDPPYVTPWSIFLAEVASGGVGAHLLHALAEVPPWLGGGLTALIVGALLRVLDPALKRAGERVANRLTPPPPSPPNRSETP